MHLKKVTICFIIIISSLKVISQEKNTFTENKERIVYHKFDKQFYNQLQTKKNTNETLNLLLTILFPPIVSLLGIYLMRKDVKKQLKISQEHFAKAIEITFIKEFSDNLSKLIVILNPNSGIDYIKLKDKGFVSTEHELLHTKLTILLNDKNEDEKRFLSILEQTHNQIDNLLINLSLLKDEGNKIINSRKENIYETI